MATIATGQLTIIDYNDALTLTGYIGSNVVKTQTYNPDNEKFNPDWSKTPFLVLTPSLYKIGTTTDIITSAEVTKVEWFELLNGTETKITATATRTFSGSKNHILTIKTNEIGSGSAKDYICVVTYLDPTTNLSITHKMSISFGKINNGSAVTTAVALCPNGNVFKNSLVETLTATCDLYRGAVADKTNVTYQWYKQDSSVTTDEGGGIGWKKIVNASGSYAGCTTRELTVYASAVTNIGVFKCIIKDTDTASPTYNQSFFDTVTFIDNTDPVVVQIQSTGGDVFKNGSGSSTLTAKLFQAGTEIDSAGTGYTYTWKKYKNDGTLDTGWSKTGKSISVSGDDVDIKSTFEVIVTK